MQIIALLRNGLKNAFENRAEPPSHAFSVFESSLLSNQARCFEVKRVGYIRRSTRCVADAPRSRSAKSVP